MKKPKSNVTGDILSQLVNPLSDTIGVFLCPIFNRCFCRGIWPSAWRTETQTVIPKGTDPTSFDELLNLSYTNFFSKLMEVFLLKRLLDEATTSQNQYGEIKGSGTNHFLIT